VEQLDPSDAGDLDKLNAEFAPSAFSPSAFSPWAFSPFAFSPFAFSLFAFSGDELSPEFSPSAFSDAFIGAQVSTIIALSAGIGTEQIIVDTWNNTGDFYVRVTGKNGAFNPTADFQLFVELKGELCKDVDVRAPVHVTASAGVGSGYDTIILWDRDRMAIAGNSATDIDNLGAKLTELAGRPEVNGILVDLAQYSHLDFLHEQANDTLPSLPPVFATNVALNRPAGHNSRQSGHAGFSGDRANPLTLR